VSQKAAVTPTQRVLCGPNGPQRIQRPVSHQKSVSHVSIAVKSKHPADQNVNPATVNVNPAPQPKRGCQQNPQETRIPSANPVSAKPPSESAKLEKAQRKHTKLDKLIISVCILDAKTYPF